MTIDEQVEFLIGDASEIILREELAAKLELGRPLRIKYGADPSAPDLHLGHSVPMSRLRKFQELGHQVIFIIGDFTGRIGDPSGRSKTRPMLTSEEIDANATTFAEQAGQILDMHACEVRYNSELRGLPASQSRSRLCQRYTVARMLERDDFAKRLANETAISVQELLYPLMQAYDSVAIESDVEVGGTDQFFNLLVGRDIMRAYDMQPQVVATWSLLVGTDGVEKMSKSLGNYVGITDEPADMFGKLMSIPDDVLPHYFALLTDRGFDGAEQLDADIQSGEVHPMDAKKELAGIIVERYHDADAAVAARAEFENVFSRGNVPSDMPESEVAAADLDDGQIWIVRLVVAAGFAASNGEARRLVRGGGVKLGDEKVADENAQVAVADGDILQVGKRRFARLKIV